MELRRVVVTGMGAVTPLGCGVEATWTNILASKSGLTRVIDKMEAAGLVRRERPPGDRRVVLVMVTERGLETLREARRFHRDGIRRHFAEHLTKAELASLAPLGVELVLWTLDELLLAGEGARRREMAAGR